MNVIEELLGNKLDTVVRLIHMYDNNTEVDKSSRIGVGRLQIRFLRILNLAKINPHAHSAGNPPSSFF